MSALHSLCEHNFKLRGDEETGKLFLDVAVDLSWHTYGILTVQMEVAAVERPLVVPDDEQSMHGYMATFNANVASTLA